MKRVGPNGWMLGVGLFVGTWIATGAPPLGAVDESPATVTVDSPVSSDLTGGITPADIPSNPVSGGDVRLFPINETALPGVGENPLPGPTALPPQEVLTPDAAPAVATEGLESPLPGDEPTEVTTPSIEASSAEALPADTETAVGGTSTVSAEGSAPAEATEAPAAAPEDTAPTTPPAEAPSANSAPASSESNGESTATESAESADASPSEGASATTEPRAEIDSPEATSTTAPDAQPAPSPVSDATAAPSIPVPSVDFRPIEARQLDQVRGQIAHATRDLERFLQRGTAANLAAWKAFLHWDKLEAITTQEANAETITEVLGRFLGGEPGLELPAFVAVREPLVAYLRLVQAQGDEKVAERLQEQLKTIVEKTPLAVADAAEHQTDLANRLEWLSQLGQAPEVAQSVRGQFAKPNLLVSVSAQTIASGFNEQVSEVTPIHEQILKTYVQGSAHTVGHLSATLVPAHDHAVVELTLQGQSHSQTVGRQKPVTIHSRGVTQIFARKRILIDEVGIRACPAAACCETHNQICSIQPDRRFGGRMIERIAWKKAGEQQPAAEKISSQRAEARIASRLDQRVLERISDSNAKLQQKVRDPLRKRNIYPDLVQFSSNSDRMHIVARQARTNQLAAATDPPTVPAHQLLMHIHESMIANTAVGAVGGMTITDERAQELIKEMTGEVPPELALKEDEDPWSITFDLQQPVQVKFQGNRVTIAIRGRRFTRGEQVVTQTTQIGATYTIELVEGRARLVRQGDVEVTFPGKDGERLSLTELRNKTFFTSKFQGLFKPVIEGKGLQMADRWSKLDDLGLRFASSDHGWLSLGWDE